MNTHRFSINTEIALCLLPIGPSLLMLLKTQPDYHSNMSRHFWKVFQVHLLLTWVLHVTRQKQKIKNAVYEKSKRSVHRGYYTVVRSYELYVRGARTISSEWVEMTALQIQNNEVNYTGIVLISKCETEPEHVYARTPNYLHEHVEDLATVLTTSIILWWEQHFISWNAERGNSFGATDQPDDYIRHAVLRLKRKKKKR